MFKITSNSGFHLGFDNGIVLSVQFGPGNYCQNYDMNINEKYENPGKKYKCDDAELLCMYKDKNSDSKALYYIWPCNFLKDVNDDEEWCDDVEGCVDIDKFVAILNGIMQYDEDMIRKKLKLKD